jgi:hypothetical protein
MWGSYIPTYEMTLVEFDRAAAHVLLLYSSVTIMCRPKNNPPALGSLAKGISQNLEESYGVEPCPLSGAIRFRGGPRHRQG